jgi:hypothetical protein
LLAARSFFGMVVYHFLVQELFGGEKYQKFDGEEVAGVLAAIWLGGMQTANRVSRSSRHPRQAATGRINGRNVNGRTHDALMHRLSADSKPL